MIPKETPVAGLDTEKPVLPLAGNRSQPEYHAPESMIGAIRAVLRSAGFQGVQEFQPPLFLHARPVSYLHELRSST